MNPALLIAVAVLLALLYGLWALVPILAGLPYRATAPQRVRRALELAQVKPGETVYDLGCGDGRIAIAAARDFGARAVGVEFSPLHCLLSWTNARLQGQGSRVRIRLGDFYKVNLSAADVVVAYMTSRQAPRLMPLLERQLRPGARVVTIAFDLDGWQPQEMDRESLLFLYLMPPTAGSLESYMAQQAGLTK